MYFFKKLLENTGHIIFVIFLIFFSTLHAKNVERFNKADSISDYFSGTVLLNQSDYKNSYGFLKNLDGLEASHSVYSTKYLYALINSGKFNEAYNYSKKLNKRNQESFESNLIMGIFYLKNSKYDNASEYFLKAKKRETKSILDNYLVNSLYIWSKVQNYNLNEAIILLSQQDDRFNNLQKIQNVFLHCFYNSSDTSQLFNELVSDTKTDFSRYNYFYAKYLDSISSFSKAEKVLNDSLKKYPRNLILNQYKLDRISDNYKFNFDCKKQQNVSAEIIYITANALSSQSIYILSNFYLNLSKYLNADFNLFNTLLAENYYKIEDYDNSKKTYNILSKNGEAVRWYSNKQISRILILENDKEGSLKLLQKAYKELDNKDIYATFDYAEFLKNTERFEESIDYYTIALKKVDKDHPLFPKILDSRGVAYERSGQWKKAEKDLLASLEVSPDQAYVINYLAYSWIEQGVKIEESLKMLEKANELKSNDPYIIDSLGWALFKLNRYEEAKDYLQLAVRLMPADPIVNDHYGDVLWKNGNEIQARYYWNYVLNLEKTERDLKKKVETKLISGL